MRKILMILVCSLLLTACKSDILIEDIENHLNHMNISKYDIIVKSAYNNEFEFAIYNAGEDNQIFTTCTIIEDEGIFYKVTSGSSFPVYSHEKLSCYDFPSKYTGCKGSYYIGITYEDIKDIYYDDRKMDIHQKNVRYGNEEKVMTYWIYEYTDGEVNNDLIQYVYK